MKWVPDKSGRFAKRPHYLPEDLDDECECIISAFLQQKYGKVEFPVRTDDLTVLIGPSSHLSGFIRLSSHNLPTAVQNCYYLRFISKSN